MRAPRLLRLLSVVVLLGALAWLLRPEARAPHAASVPVDTASATALPGFLPPEAGPVIRTIQRGGRLPHRQDGSVFGNREQRLPPRERGYYREYTVPTPGLPHRGARRIVTGGDPPVEWYYSGDHYGSFRAFRPPATEERR